MLLDGAEHDGFIVPVGEAGDLQLEFSLVGPEPGQGGIAGGLAHEPGRHGLGLVHGILNRLEPDGLW